MGIILVVIQFIHPKKNENTEILATDITKVASVPEEVLQVLKLLVMIATVILLPILGITISSLLLGG